MPLSVVRFEDTPNPDALKCVLSAPAPPLQTDKPRSYADPADALAAGDAPAEAILRIPGVTRVLIGHGWLTVTRAPGSPWAPIKSALGRALQQFP